MMDNGIQEEEGNRERKRCRDAQRKTERDSAGELQIDTDRQRERDRESEREAVPLGISQVDTLEVPRIAPFTQITANTANYQEHAMTFLGFFNLIIR